MGGALATGAGVLVGGTVVPGAVVACLVFAGAVAVIYLRGYLVPGTPTLTKRYAPVTLLRSVDVDDDRSYDVDDDRSYDGDDGRSIDGDDDSAVDDDLDPEAAFREVGVLEADPGAEDLVLAPAFEAAWTGAIDDVAGDDSGIRNWLADVVGLDPDDVDLERRPGSFVARHDGARIVRWESKAACRADAAAARVLPRFDPGWADRPFATRLSLLATLRLFLESCPTCGGGVTLSRDVVDSCCHGHDVVAATCDGCTARIFEMPIRPGMFDPDGSVTLERE